MKSQKTPFSLKDKSNNLFGNFFKNQHQKPIYYSKKLIFLVQKRDIHHLKIILFVSNKHFYLLE